MLDQDGRLLHKLRLPSLHGCERGLRPLWPDARARELGRAKRKGKLTLGESSFLEDGTEATVHGCSACAALLREWIDEGEARAMRSGSGRSVVASSAGGSLFGDDGPVKD